MEIPLIQWSPVAAFRNIGIVGVGTSEVSHNFYRKTLNLKMTDSIRGTDTRIGDILLVSRNLASACEDVETNGEGIEQGSMKENTEQLHRE